MSFWDTGEGDSAANVGTEYDAGGGNFDPIPDGTSVLACLDEVSWAEDKEGNRFVSARWSVLDPEEYKNRKIFQKLWVADLEPRAAAKDVGKAEKKRANHLRLLAAIDKNCGGKLTSVEGEPTSDDLALNLLNCPMVIKVMLWEMQDNERPGEMVRGNWVAAVASTQGNAKSPATTAKPASPPRTPRLTKPPAADPLDLDDDIPF